MNPVPAHITPKKRKAIKALARDLDQTYRFSERTARWASLRYTGNHSRRTGFFMEDLSEIPCLESLEGVPYYQLRSRVRAREGDLFLTSNPDVPGYEVYNQEYLGLGEAHCIYLEGCESPFHIARSLTRSPETIYRIGDLLRGPQLVIEPYMGGMDVWTLGETIKRILGISVQVLAPAPEITRFVNNKKYFTQITQNLLGVPFVIESHYVNTLDAMACAMRHVANRARRVCVKMPRTASALGNKLFDSQAILQWDDTTLHGVITDFLNNKAWDGHEDILIMEWSEDVIESPSSQVWIPVHGDPIIDGIYTQHLVADKKTFLGSSPSTLPRRCQKDFARWSMELAFLYQCLGYVGRCSFDAILCGTDVDTAQLKYVECNGRWGGTSIPMQLVSRVVAGRRSFTYRAQDYIDPRLKGVPFDALKKIFGTHLYDRRDGVGDVILYNVGCLEGWGKFDIIVLGETLAEVTEFIQKRVPELISAACGG